MSKRFGGEFLVVIKTSKQTDLSSEFRHVVRLGGPALAKRPAKSTLRQLHQRLRWELADYLPEKGGDFYAWALNGGGRPAAFVTGLLAIAEGRMTKAQANALNRRLLPQVTIPQSLQEFRFLVRAMGEAWDYDDGEGELEDRDYDLLDGLFGGLDWAELVDSDLYDGTLSVIADICHRVSAQLPFAPSKDCSVAQLRCAEVLAAAALDQELFNGGETLLHSVWLLGPEGQPFAWITGIREQKEGLLLSRRFKKEEAKCLDGIPSSLIRGSKVAA